MANESPANQPFELSDDELLDRLAFRAVEFPPQVLSEMTREAERRGFTNETIRGYRDTHFGYQTALTKCYSCHVELRLDRGELVKGEFECPICHRRQAVVYSTLYNQSTSVHHPAESQSQAGQGTQPADKTSYYQERLQQAEKYIGRGFIVALIISGLTVLFVIVGLFVSSSGVLATAGDPLNLIDVALVLLLASGLKRKSRLAAVGLVFYYLVSRIIAIDELGLLGLPFAVILLIFLVIAAVWTFRYHSIRREIDPTYKPEFKTPILWIAAPAIVLILALCVWYVLEIVGVFPQDVVKAGSSLSEDEITMLRSTGVLQADEQVEWYYTVDGLDLDGSLVTDDRVVTYFVEADSVVVFDVTYRDMWGASVEYATGATEYYTLIEIYFTQDSIFYFDVSNEEGLDSVFYDALLENFRDANPDYIIE